MNPLYNDFKNDIPGDMFNSISQQAMQLKKELKADPKQIVQNMLNSGQISQQAFNQVFPLATRIGEMMAKK